MSKNLLRGRGSQFNPRNNFDQYHIEENPAYQDEALGAPTTKVFEETPRTIVSINDSPDLKMDYSINPYQGCEHGCIYCFARNSHEYWGFGAGLDFESKIVVKKNAAIVLEKQLLNRNWKVKPIMLSGNTECYQPLERRYGLTRELIKILSRFRHPFSVITKNTLVTRDVDLLTPLAELGLVSVYFSITTLDESLRRKMEPRTASAIGKLKAIEQLSKAGIPTGVMNAPIIPGINHHETPEILRLSAEAGARGAAYTIVRLNGKIGEMMKDWLEKAYPDRANKVWNLTCQMHEGKVNDSEWGQRLLGSGNISESIKMLFNASKQKFFKGRRMPELRTDLFRRQGNYTLFD
ncbi:MAG: PA0069 family radical SAM protein [Cyclobacteriaceae bacterium]